MPLSEIMPRLENMGLRVQSEIPYEVTPLGAESFAGQTRAFLKVQEGCNLFFTFCIVPMARGRSRSVEPRRVLAELERLAALGYRGAVLTGIHLGGYGKDLTPSLTFADLVEMIAEAAPLPRIRLSSIDPPEVTPRLLDMIATSPVLCEHLHARAGRRRRRPAPDATALRRGPGARRRRRDPSTAARRGVATSSPGSRARPTRIRRDRGAAARGRVHVSARVSLLAADRHHRGESERPSAGAGDPRARPGAPAAGAQQREAFAAGCVGRELDVLIETTRDTATGRLIGYSRNYARVVVDGPDALANREVRVRAVAREGDRLRGERVGDADAAAAR